VDGVLTDALVPRPQVPMQPEVYQTIDAIDAEMSRQLGVSDFQEAVIPDKKMLATEVNALEASGGARMAGVAKRYRLFREDGAACLLILLQKFSNRMRAYKFDTEDGKKTWGAMSMVELRGEKSDGDLEDIGIQFRVKINASSEAPKNKLQDLEMKMKALQTAVPFIQMPDPVTGGPMVNIKALLRAIFKAMDLDNVSDIVPPDPTPQEQQAAMEQQAQVAQIQGVMQGLQSGGGANAGGGGNPPQ